MEKVIFVVGWILLVSVLLTGCGMEAEHVETSGQYFAEKGSATQPEIEQVKLSYTYLRSVASERAAREVDWQIFEITNIEVSGSAVTYTLKDADEYVSYLQIDFNKPNQPSWRSLVSLSEKWPDALDRRCYRDHQFEDGDFVYEFGHMKN